MKFARVGVQLLFGLGGRGGAVFGVAELAGKAIKAVPAGSQDKVQLWMDSILHAPLAEYLEPAQSFDAVRVASVYDLRGAKLTWADLEERLACERPRQTQGFPSVGGEDVRCRLLQLCIDVAAPQRHPPPRMLETCEPSLHDW